MSGPVPACWRGDDARSIFVTEALEGNDAIFLATHTPIHGFDLSGRDAGEIASPDEEAVLDALAAPAREHAFCVVQGEPGSGKSHLIRWLSVNWPNANDRKLLLRRADGSLEGALRQLKNALPPEFAPLFDNLGQRQRASQSGRARIFLSTLATTLEPGTFDVPLEDEDWCRKFAPAELLAHPTVKERWKAPSDILKLLEGAGGSRNSASASFDLFHIQELGDIVASLRGQAAIAHSQSLANKLSREADDIRAFREQDWLPAELATEHADLFETSIKLADALNRRRNDAIQNVLGVSAQGLKTLFRQVREALAEKNERLVLLLEDITSWEGLDDSLIDVLVFNAAAKGDQDRPVCPLISVVGVTPAYYEKLAGNYRQRITHEIKLGHSTGGLQDVTALRDPAFRRQFATRYLSAVRAGPAALETWLKEVRSGEETPPPNRCAECPRQETCFATFGAQDDIGLFPFSPQALDRFFEALKDNDNGQTWKTPRGILQAILNPNLIQPDALATGTYPGATIEPEAFRQDRRSGLALSNRLAQIVANAVDDPLEEARIRRVLAYWGNPNSADTVEVDGVMSFAGISRDLYDAFGLPWLGGDTATGTGRPAAPVPPVPEAELLPVTPDQPPAAPFPTGRADIGRAQRSTVTPAKPKRLTQSTTDLERLREQIRSWGTSTGGAIDDPDKWNSLLYSLIEQIDCRRLKMPQPLVRRIITPEMVKLEGTTSGQRAYLLIKPEPWVRNGLEAYLALKVDAGRSPDDDAFHRRNFAAMVQGLERAAIGYLDRRIPRLQDKSRWSPVATFAQILLARAWLRGNTGAQAPVTDQIRTILSDEADPESGIVSRSAPWQEWLNATNRSHHPLRATLRQMVGLGISEGVGGAPLTDASELAGAVARFAQTTRFDPVPTEEGGLPDQFRRARELAETWNEKRAQIERIESAQLVNRAQALGGLLRNKTVKAHLERIDRCVTGISDLLPAAVPDRVAAWKMAYARLQPQLEADAGARTEDLILAIETEEMPTQAPERLTWLAAAPARDLEELLNAAQQGERLVEALRDHARDCISEAGGAGSLAEVKRAGEALRSAAEAKFEAETAQ